MRKALVAVAVAAVVGGCGDDAASTDPENDTPTVSQSIDADSEPADAADESPTATRDDDGSDGSAPTGPRVLTKADTEEPWPFTVDRVTLRCEGSSGAGMVVVRAGGKDYGVNGTALSRYPRVDPIWRKEPGVPGMRVNIGEVLDRGLELCE